MGHAVVTVSAAKAGTTGGTFADTLTAASPDSLTVATYVQSDPNVPGARILEWWGMDDTSAAELELFYSRPLSTHDQTHGQRSQVASLLAGSAGKIGAQEFLPGGIVIDVFPSDVANILATTTASDNIACSMNIEYDDLPGAAGVFSSLGQVNNLRKSTLGIFCNAVGSATHGAYGTARAFNADDNRLHANTWYAILGFTVRTPVMTVSLLGTDFGGQRIGAPGDPLSFRTASWWADQAQKWNKPLIPCFNSNNAGAISVQILDAGASVTPSLDFQLYELSAMPTPGS